MFRVTLVCLLAVMAVVSHNAAAHGQAGNPLVVDALAASELALANLEQVIQAQAARKQSNPEVVNALAASELALANLEQVVQGKPSLKLDDVQQYPRTKRWLYDIGYKVGGFAGDLARRYFHGKR